MDYTASTDHEPTPASAAGPTEARDRNIALVCSLLLLVGMPIGYLPGSTGDTIALIVLSLVMLGLMAGVVLWLAPRERAAGRDSRTALILGIVALLAVVVFWTGLPFPLGAGAIALGLSARATTPAGRARPTVAVVLGGLAVVASFAALLFG